MQQARPSEVSWALKQQIAEYGGKFAVVTTARPLSDEQMAALRRVLGNSVTLKTNTDPDILGGMIIKVGSKMIDDSVRTKLARMEASMKRAL